MRPEGVENTRSSPVTGGSAKSSTPTTRPSGGSVLPIKRRLDVCEREMTWFEVVVADAVERYDATPEHFKPVVVVSRRAD